MFDKPNLDQNHLRAFTLSKVEGSKSSKNRIDRKLEIHLDVGESVSIEIGSNLIGKDILVVIGLRGKANVQYNMENTIEYKQDDFRSKLDQVVAGKRDSMWIIMNQCNNSVLKINISAIDVSGVGIRWLSLWELSSSFKQVYDHDI